MSIRATNKMHIPITVSAPATLFTKVYPRHHAHARLKGTDTLLQQETTFQEQQKGRKLKRATARTISHLSRGLIVVMNYFRNCYDNDPKSKSTEELLRHHGIPQIHISPYNSQPTELLNEDILQYEKD